MKLAIILIAAALHAADSPLYVFDNGSGRGELNVEQQTELAQRTGYAGIFYSGFKDLPQLVAAHKQRGMHMVGIYTGMNLKDPLPTYDRALPEAIRLLKGTGALITFTVNGSVLNGDDIATPVVREVAAMAAAARLKVALYPHYGFHIARIEDALRLIEKVNRPNVGLVFNLCHWLRSGDEANMQARLKQALPKTLMVSINGADHEGDWTRLIQTLDRGTFDVKAFVHTVRSMGFKGPIGLQCYNVKGDREENLKRSMRAWRAF
ncbi:MAG: sugar phosphate isomerase/epimerase [Acidobacteria bacterium]|nr:sugar phosphate isomerase/epimerase [Acidobacteriota bacterium]